MTDRQTDRLLLVLLIKILCFFLVLPKWRKKAEVKLLSYLKHNEFILVKEDGTIIKNPKIKGLKVSFRGENSKVEIHAPYNFRKCNITLGDNACVKIGKTKYKIDKLSISQMNNNSVEIGENFSTFYCRMLMQDEKHTFIKIGDDCMFSTGIVILPSDGHTLYDKNTGEILNKPIGITIHDHVWVGRDVYILKNTEIPSNCVVGSRSLVTKKFTEEYTAIAGSPAKVIKHNINWDRENTDNFVSKTK